MRSLLLALVATLASLAMGECVLRGAGLEPTPPPLDPSEHDADWPQPDPVLGWSNRPGTGHSNEQGHVAMTFGPDGQRASSRVGDPPRGHSVWLVGCSFTAGVGVADDETFAWRLNERYPDFHFENHGVPGYGTYQSLLLLERLLRQSHGRPPELVVYAFIGDHTKRNVASLKWLRNLKDSRGLFTVPPRVAVEADGLAAYPSSRIDFWPLERHSLLVGRLHDLWLRMRLADRDRQKIAATDRLLERMDREVREAGSHLLVAQLDDMPPETLAFMAERDIATVDCIAPAYKSDPKYRVGGVGHPSGLRHALWAECLQREFEAKRLL